MFTLARVCWGSTSMSSSALAISTLPLVSGLSLLMICLKFLLTGPMMGFLTALVSGLSLCLVMVTSSSVSLLSLISSGSSSNPSCFFQ